MPSEQRLSTHGILSTYGISICSLRLSTGCIAGCTLASRLSEDPETTVLLLERGPANDTWMSRIPIVSSDLYHPSNGAAFWVCEPMKHCNDRKTSVFCSETLGGGSRINAMIYTRGIAAEYDAWADMGHSNWSYKKVLPCFIRAEKSPNRPKSNCRVPGMLLMGVIFERSLMCRKVHGSIGLLIIPVGCLKCSRYEYLLSYINSFFNF